MHIILSNWYGPSAKSWPISDELVLYIAKMIVASQGCTQSFSLVPRSSGPIDTLRSLSTLARQEIKAIIKNVASDKHAIACLKGVAYQMKFEVYMLKDGL